MLQTRVDASVQCMRVSTEEDQAQFFKHTGPSEHVNVGTYQQLVPVLAMTKVVVLTNINASMAVQKCTKPQENAANTSLIDKLCFPNSLL